MSLSLLISRRCISQSLIGLPRRRRKRRKSCWRSRVRQQQQQLSELSELSEWSQAIVTDRAITARFTVANRHACPVCSSLCCICVCVFVCSLSQQAPASLSARSVSSVRCRSNADFFFFFFTTSPSFLPSSSFSSLTVTVSAARAAPEKTKPRLLRTEQEAAIFFDHRAPLLSSLALLSALVSSDCLPWSY